MCLIKRVGLKLASFTTRQLVECGTMSSFRRNKYCRIR